MADQFADLSPGLNSPASKIVALTPDDSVDLTATTRGLLVMGAGNVAVILAGDISAVTIVNVPACSTLPIRVRRLMAANTSATNIYGLS